jgi:hypothetical protein
MEIVLFLIPINVYCSRDNVAAVYLLEYINIVANARERTVPTERPPLVGEVSAIFADRGCQVVSVQLILHLIFQVL